MISNNSSSRPLKLFFSCSVGPAVYFYCYFAYYQMSIYTCFHLQAYKLNLHKISAIVCFFASLDMAVAFERADICLLWQDLK